MRNDSNASGLSLKSIPANKELYIEQDKAVFIIAFDYVTNETNFE